MPYRHSWSPAFKATPVVLASAIFALIPPVLAQAPTQDLHTATQTELDVVKVVLAQEHAWNNGDIESYVHQFKNSPETLIVGHQIDRGYSQIEEDYKRNYSSRSAMGNLGFSELEVHALGEEYAICLGKYHLDRNKKEGGPADGVFSMVMEKTAEGWKIVLDHTT